MRSSDVFNSAFHRKRGNLYVIAALSLLFSLFTAPAYADAGTPLMWVSSFHLTIGNAIIGAIEGLLIARWWKVKGGYAAGIMILANYISTIAGFVLYYLLTVAGGIEDPSAIEFSLLKLVLVVSILVLFALTVIIEWPFVRITFRKALQPIKNPWLNALKASLIVNSISYTWLIILILVFGNINVVTRTVYDPEASFLKNRTGHVYYYDDSKQAVCRVTLDGKKDTFTVPASLSDDFGTWSFLYAKKSSKSGSWDLCVRNKEANENKDKVILKSFSKAATDVFYFYGKRKNEVSYSTFQAMDFRKPSDIKCYISVEFWANPGLTVEDRKTGKEDSYGLETGFMMNFSRRPTVLPGDIVIWELGGRIMAMDLNTRHITQLARGKSPVVTLD